MPNHRIAARPPRGAPRMPMRITDPDRLRSIAEDAAHVAGEAAALVLPSTEAEAAEIVRASPMVLAIGAQSSLTGGATPRGEVVVSTARFNRIRDITADRAHTGAGVPLVELDRSLARGGRYYPPAPTFTGAFVGGTVATNAAGAATFKYGTTRDWVEAMTVVLATGDVLDIERGRVHAHPDGYFEIQQSAGTVRVPVPHYRMPEVPKISAGYFAAPGMDLIDLFIGSEGTLGIVVDVTLRVLEPRPGWCMAFVPFDDSDAAFAFVRTLRAAAQQTWQMRPRSGLDVSAIELLDERCLELAREDGLDTRTGIRWPLGTRIALLVTLELPSNLTSAEAFEQIGRASAASDADAPLVRFCNEVARVAELGEVQIAVPGDSSRMSQLLAFREEVPASVNRRVGLAKHEDPRVEKTAGDMIVPFARMHEVLDCFHDVFGRRGLDVAVWGHVSDGNLHPNVLPRSFADVEAGRAAILEIGREVIRLGGSPLAEHGVGRNQIKQQLLAELYGPEGIDQMRAVKRALDPQWKLAPGVVFPPA